jgi:signal transduction histidine kinase
MSEHDSRTTLIIFIVTTLVVFLLLGFILAMLSFHRKRQQKFAVELERVRANFEKELLKTQLEIQEQTFQYISQEIHDNIGQFISLAKLQLNTLNFRSLPSVKEQVAHSADLLTKALEDLRDLSRSLSSEVIRSNGLATAVELQIAQLRKLELPEVNYEVKGEYQFLDEQKEIFILRILQEAVNNIVRHSDARAVTIQLNYMEANLSLYIVDNGKGFDPAVIGDGSSSGIGNMNRRAEMIGAIFKIDSAPGVGTAVNLLVPY